jgi:uncharacterized repeat protein (TIGR01451 family)
MKYIFTAMLLMATCFSTAQIVNIPDANFKAVLIRLGVDANNDGEIQQAEADAVAHIEIVSTWNLPVSDLTGIRSFTNLETLSCTQNPVTVLDVSGLANLQSLNCTWNQISTVNITGCNNLVSVDLSDNNVKALSFANHPTIQSVKLSYNMFFNISDSVHIRFDAINCPVLKTVDIHNNYTSMNISGANVVKLVNCDSLTTLKLFGVLLDTLDISQSDGLKELGTFRGLNYLIAKNCLSLTHIYSDAAQYAGIGNADVTGCINLESISYGEAGMVQRVDLSTCPKIKTVVIPYTSASPLYLNLKNGTRMVDCSVGVRPNDPASAYLNICADDLDIDSVSNWLHFINTLTPPVTNINSYCSFYPGGAYNTIKGKLRIDDDNNGCNNGGRPLVMVPMRFADTTGQSIITYSNNNGDYAVFTYKGLFSFMPYFPYPFFTFSPANPVVSFDTANSLINTTNFCLHPNGVHNNLSISFLPLSPARPGFDAAYRIVYKNYGTTALSGNITLNFDNSKMNFIFSSSTIATQSTGQITWNYNNLLPFESSKIDVAFNLLPPPVNNIGDTIFYLAAITPSANDETAFDNSFILPQRVIGSFDPNDKQCLEGSKLDISKLGDYLHYQIHFQNEGTDTAFNVVVADTLSNKLDWNTFELIGSSHPVDAKLTNNKAEFIFENIHLPYKAINEPASNGWVAFKIKPKPSVVIGDSLNNKAAIYFDFNKPVITNTATTIVSSSSTPVPVKLEYFAVNQKNNANVLNWKASCTYGNAIFVIERSEDGIHFNSIGNVAATALRCQLPLNFKDNNPMPGKNYYRLKITDADGISFYSKILVIGNGKAGLQITAITNNSIYLNSNKQQTIQMKVIAADGREIWNEKQTLAAGNNGINLQMKNIAKGIYTLIVFTGDGAMIAKKFIK